MLRRMLPTLAVLGLFLVALLWGLGSLQGIIIDERLEAHARVWSERNALQEYARRTLEQRLEAQLHTAEAEINLAQDDPLMATQTLMLIERGRQLFPRPVRYAAGATHARELYYELHEGMKPSAVEPGSPWAERVRLMRRFRTAVLEGEPEEIEGTFRAMLAHRSRFVISSRLDIPARLAMLDILVDGTDPNPELLADLLRNGLQIGDQVVVEGLQPALLRRRDRFSASDFQFLSGRVIELSERAQTRVDDFQARAAEPVNLPLGAPPSLQESSLVLGGTWYARPDGYDRIVGLVIGLDDLLRSVEEEMRARALLTPTDALIRPPVSDPVVPLSSLAIDVQSPRFSRAIAASDKRFWVKTGFVAGSAALALIIVVLAFAVQSRKQRFVELKSDFVATVSHELRTPLASVRLMAETLERRTAGLPAARDYPTRIVREIDDLAFLVENILSFNRLDKGRWKPRHEATSIRELVDELSHELRATPSVPGQRSARLLEIDASGLDDIVLHADRELLRLLLRNLMRNACTYNERDPIRLRLSSRIERRHFKLDVEDNGVGIPPTEQKRVFSDFYRPGHAQARGSGLGLAICRKIMQAHEGRIRLASSDSQGTRFTLLFPVHMVLQR